MRARVMFVSGALALAGLGLSAPVAGAVPVADSGVETRTAAEAATLCSGTAAATYHSISCYNRAPGNQYRAGIDCTNSGWRYGPWRRQTANLSTTSRVNCPAGGTAQAYRVQFRTA